MTLNAPPIQEVTADQLGRFPQVWIRWFQDVVTNINNLIDIVDNIVIGPDITDIRTITASATLLNTDATILCDATAGIFTVTLPNVVTFEKFKFSIKKKDTGVNDVTISGGGADIDGASTRLLSGAGNPSITVQSDGTDWWIL